MQYEYYFEGINYANLQDLIARVEKDFGIKCVGAMSGSANVTSLAFEEEVKPDIQENLQKYLFNLGLVKDVEVITGEKVTTEISPTKTLTKEELSFEKAPALNKQTKVQEFTPKEIIYLKMEVLDG